MRQELLVTAIIFILLFLKLGNRERKAESLLTIINILLGLNLAAGFFPMDGNITSDLFGQMFHTNTLIIFEKNILSLGTLIISLQSYQWLRSNSHVPEFYILMLSTLLGMFFMISSGNLLMFYLGLELSTIPLAALCNFNLEKRISSEAALKMIISSAFSSALLLFGISMMYGITGTLNFSELTAHLNVYTPQLFLFAFILVIAGFFFKISAVPFHLWTADVYEGSPIAVTSYLSVVSKGAILFVLTSVLYNAFSVLENSWYNIVFLISVLTMMVGNLFALRQQNMKRFLAFSSIAQIGFILIGISGASVAGSASVIFFVLIYVFSNLGAFGVISVVSALTGKERIDDYKGFHKTNPLLAWVLTISLFSLAGIPPTAGFFGKFFLLMAGAGKGNFVLITIAALNMVISLYYYLRIVKSMFMETSEDPIKKIYSGRPAHISYTICIGGIFITGFMSGVYQYIFSLF